MSPHDLEPLDAHLKALLDAERARPAVAPELRARVFSRVNATLGLGGPGGGGGGAPPAAGAAGAGAGAAAAGPLLGGLLKPILLGLALGGAVVAGAAARSEPTPAPPFAAPAASSPALAERIAAPGAAAIEPTAAGAPAPSAAAPAPPPAAESATAGHDADLAAERRILDEAQRALAGGRSAAAFEALARHASEFPRGRLSEEREGLSIRALVGAGRVDEARARAARFRRLFPESMLLPALESMLGTIP